MISSQFKLIGIKTSLAGILILALFVLVPKLALAASVYLTVDDPAIAVGDTIIVNLEMDTLDKNPNVVEGDVVIKDGAGNIDGRG